MSALMKRRSRYERLRAAARRASSNIIRGSVLPGAAYGAKVIGMPPAMLAGLRRLMLLTQPRRTKTNSVTMQYMTASNSTADPTYTALGYPMGFWARMAFGDEGVQEAMQKAWIRQYPRLGSMKRPWTGVAGPAGATIMATKEARMEDVISLRSDDRD